MVTERDAMAELEEMNHANLLAIAKTAFKVIGLYSEVTQILVMAQPNVIGMFAQPILLADSLMKDMRKRLDIQQQPIERPIEQSEFEDESDDGE